MNNKSIQYTLFCAVIYSMWLCQLICIFNFFFLELGNLCPRNEKQLLLMSRYKQRLKRLQAEHKQVDSQLHQQKPASGNDILEVDLQHLTETQLEFLACQLINAKMTARGRRWSNVSKGLAVALRTQAPKGYLLLSNMFPLLSISTVEIL